MPVRLASSPNGHGFAALWVEFPDPQSDRKRTVPNRLAPVWNRSFSIALLLLHRTFATGYRFQCNKVHHSKELVMIITEKIRNRDSIKMKVLGEEGVGASRAGSFWEEENRGVLLSPISKSLYCPQHAQRSILAPSRKRICILSGGKISCTTPLPNLG